MATTATAATAPTGTAQQRLEALQRNLRQVRARQTEVDTVSAEASAAAARAARVVASRQKGHSYNINARRPPPHHSQSTTTSNGIEYAQGPRTRPDDGRSLNPRRRSPAKRAGREHQSFRAPQQHQPTHEFGMALLRFRERAAREKRLQALQASEFADKTPFLRFHAEDVQGSEIRRRWPRPRNPSPGELDWPPPRLVDFGELDVSLTELETSGITLKQALKSELAVAGVAGDAARDKLRRHSQVVRALVKDEAVVYIDALHAQVPLLVESSLRVGDELVTVGEVGTPRSVKFTPGTAVESVEQMVTNTAVGRDIELVFFRPLAQHLQRHQQHDQQVATAHVFDAATAGEAPARTDAVSGSVQQQQQQQQQQVAPDGSGGNAAALASNKNDDDRAINTAAATDTKVAPSADHHHHPGRLLGLCSSSHVIYRRNAFISFDVQVDLVSVANLALPTLSGPMNFEMSCKKAIAAARVQHSDVRQVYRDATTTVDEYDFVFGDGDASSPSKAVAGRRYSDDGGAGPAGPLPTGPPVLSASSYDGSSRFERSGLGLKFHFNRQLNDAPDRTRAATMIDAAYDDVIRTPFGSGNDLAGLNELANVVDEYDDEEGEEIDAATATHTIDAEDSRASEAGAATTNVQRGSSSSSGVGRGVQGGEAGGSTIADDDERLADEGDDDDDADDDADNGHDHDQHPRPLPRPSMVAVRPLNLAAVAAARAAGRDRAPRLSSAAATGGAAAPSTRRLSAKFSQLFSSFEDHVQLRVFQDHHLSSNSPSETIETAGVAFLPVQKAVQAVMSEQGDQGDRLQAGEEVSSFVDCIVDDNDAANSKATFKVTLRIRGVFSRVLCRGGSLVGTGLSLYESPVNSAVYVLGGREHPSHRQHNRNDSDNAAAAAVGDGAGSGADGGADGDDQSHDPGGAASVSDVVEIGGRVYREVQTQAFGSLLARGMRLVSVGDVRIAGRMGLAAAHEVIKNMFKSRHGADDASVVLRFSGTMMDATIDARTLVHTASAMVRRLEEFARPTTGLDRKPVIRQPDIGAETGVGGHHSPGTQSRQSLQAVQSALTALRERVQPRDQARVRLGLQRLDVHGRGPPQRRTDRRRLVLQDASALRTARQQRLAETILPCIRRRLRALARGAVVVLEIVDSIQQLIHAEQVLPTNNNWLLKSEANRLDNNLRLDTFGLFVGTQTKYDCDTVADAGGDLAGVEPTEVRSLRRSVTLHRSNLDMFIVDAGDNDAAAVVQQTLADIDAAGAAGARTSAAATTAAAGALSFHDESNLRAGTGTAGLPGSPQSNNDSFSWGVGSPSVTFVEEEESRSASPAASPRRVARSQTRVHAQNAVGSWQESVDRHRQPQLDVLAHQLLLAFCDACEDDAQDDKAPLLAGFGAGAGAGAGGVPTRMMDVDDDIEAMRVRPHTPPPTEYDHAGLGMHSQPREDTAADTLFSAPDNWFDLQATRQCLLNEQIAVLHGEAPASTRTAGDQSATTKLHQHDMQSLKLVVQAVQRMGTNVRQRSEQVPGGSGTIGA